MRSRSFARLAKSGRSTPSSPCSKNFAAGWRSTERASAATTMPGPASPPIASIETVSSRAKSLPRCGRRLCHNTRALGLGLGFDHFAVPVVTAGAANVVRTLLLAAIGAFRIGGGGQTVVGPAHVPLGRRGFSFGDRHGGNSLSAPANRPKARGRAFLAFRRGGQNKARSEQETASGFKQQKPRDSLGS